eukprot:1970518-Pyramimonas_sp.AAC.1
MSKVMVYESSGVRRDACRCLDPPRSGDMCRPTTRCPWPPDLPDLLTTHSRSPGHKASPPAVIGPLAARRHEPDQDMS